MIMSLWNERNRFKMMINFNLNLKLWKSLEILMSHLERNSVSYLMTIQKIRRWGRSIAILRRARHHKGRKSQLSYRKRIWLTEIKHHIITLSLPWVQRTNHPSTFQHLQKHLIWIQLARKMPLRIEQIGTVTQVKVRIKSWRNKALMYQHLYQLRIMMLADVWIMIYQGWVNKEVFLLLINSWEAISLLILWDHHLITKLTMKVQYLMKN